MALIQRVWGSYLQALTTKPLLTKACTSGTLMGFGDTATQTLVQGKKFGENFDMLRTARMVNIEQVMYLLDLMFVSGLLWFHDSWTVIALLV